MKLLIVNSPVIPTKVHSMYSTLLLSSAAHEDNFQLQMAKLGCGLMSGEYSFDTELRNVIDEASNQVSD